MSNIIISHTSLHNIINLLLSFTLILYIIEQDFSCIVLLYKKFHLNPIWSWIFIYIYICIYIYIIYIYYICIYYIYIIYIYILYIYIYHGVAFKCLLQFFYKDTVQNWHILYYSFFVRDLRQVVTYHFRY